MSYYRARFRINDESPEQMYRRLIAYNYSIARMYNKAGGGAVEGYAPGGRRSAADAAMELASALTSGEPNKTVSAYKLFRQKDGELYPLFVNANQPVPMGRWLDAESGPLVNGKVKSSLGPLAYRPGWHAGDLPIATHIGGKSDPRINRPDYRPDNQVWAEISMPDDVDWQAEALARAQRNKAGVIIPRTAHITDQIPVGGHYRYKTNPNMTGDWLIGGSMKVNRVLPDEEVRDINVERGVSDLPRLHELMRDRGYASGGRRSAADAAMELAKGIIAYHGSPHSFDKFDISKPVEILKRYAKGGSLIQDRFPTHYLPGVGRQVMADGGAAPSMGDLIAKINSVFLPNRRAGFEAGGKRSAAEAIKKIMSYSDPASRYIDDWQWRPLSDVRADIKAKAVPPHVRNFGNYMAEMSDKAMTEGLDPEDVIKAYMITRSSIQREGRTPEKLASQGALIRPTSEPLVRPEGQMAEFLQTPEGVRFLNEARKGDLSQDVVDAARRVMKPFGMSNAEPDAMDWARRNLVERTPLVSDMVARAREAASPVSEWRDFTRDVKGIGPAKTGFIASLLGRGDLPTLDARQAILHTGMKNADVQDIMSKRSGRVGHEAVDRLAARQEALDFQLPNRLAPFYQHLAHHTVWDDVGNEKTTHQDIINAMQPRAAGGRAAFGDGGWRRQFADVVGQALERAKNVYHGDRIGVYHNLDSSRINELSNRFGGIPAPSIAISKPAANPQDFGDATLIGRPHLAIPTQENHVFPSDAYTPRFPQIHQNPYTPSEEQIRRALEHVEAAKGNKNEAIKMLMRDPDLTAEKLSMISWLGNPQRAALSEYIYDSPGSKNVVPPTIENVLSHMRSAPIIGGEGNQAGVSALRAFTARRPTSLEDFQINHRYRLAEDESEDMRNWNYLDNRFTTQAVLADPYSASPELIRNAYTKEKKYLDGLMDFHTEGNPGLMRHYPNIPNEHVLRARSLIREANEARPTYYESKPMRNVGFDEFAGAALPASSSGRSAADALEAHGMPKESIKYYFHPSERGEILMNFAKQHGFERGGSVEQAMDIVRNADFEPRRMQPSPDDIGTMRRMAQASHMDSGPGVVEMADAYLPLPFGRKVSLGQMPASTVRGVEMLAPIAAMGAQVAANFHPATRGASRALDLAQRLKFANDVRTTGHGDAADFFSMLPGGKADAMGMAAAFTDPNGSHEAARDVLNRMREGRERGGRRQAAESLAKILQGFPEYPGKSRIPVDEAYKFVVNPHHPSEDVSEAARDIIDKWGHNVASNKKGGYYNLEQTLAPQDVKPRIRQIPGVRPLDPRQMSWDDFYNIGKGGSFINIGGDRSNLGRLFGINGENLAWPVDLHAGPKYALEANPGAVWANAGNPAKSLQNAIMRAAENGPVYGILSPMSPQAVNSSHNMVDALLAQIYGRLNSGGLAHTTLDDFNDFVKSGQFAEKANREKRAKEMANMPSMRDPKAVSDFLRTVSGGARRDFSLAMDKERWRDAGMPMVGQTRVAITDPALLRTPSGGMGHRIVRFNTDNLTAPESSLAFKHSTYPVATAGEYVGDVPMLPRHYVMPTAQDQMMQTLANDSSVIHPLSVNSKGRDSARKFFEEQQLVQPIDDDFLHSVREGMARKSIYGFRKGGSVVKLARDVLFPARDAA